MISPGTVENKKSLKPPPSHFIFCPSLSKSSFATGSCTNSALIRQGSSRICSAKGMQKSLLAVRGNSSKNSARSMVPQTLETPIGCLASQNLGGNAWREGSWISLEIKRPMTHQLLEATDVGKLAGCLKPRGSTSSCRKPHLAGKHGKKQWEKQLGSASGHVAPRVKSRFAVGGSWRSSPKNAENSPSAHHSSLQSLCCEMCQ